jgi:hypothetical protein
LALCRTIVAPRSDSQPSGVVGFLLSFGGFRLFIRIDADLLQRTLLRIPEQPERIRSGFLWVHRLEGVDLSDDFILNPRPILFSVGKLVDLALQPLFACNVFLLLLLLPCLLLRELGINLLADLIRIDGLRPCTPTNSISAGKNPGLGPLVDYWFFSESRRGLRDRLGRSKVGEIRAG